MYVNLFKLKFPSLQKEETVFFFFLRDAMPRKLLIYLASDSDDADDAKEEEEVIFGFLLNILLFIYLFVFLGLHLWHMEGSRLGVKWELQLLASASAIATPDQSHICDLHHSSWQHWVLNLLSKAGDQTLNLMVPSWIH